MSFPNSLTPSVCCIFIKHIFADNTFWSLSVFFCVFLQFFFKFQFSFLTQRCFFSPIGYFCFSGNKLICVAITSLGLLGTFQSDPPHPSASRTHPDALRLVPDSDERIYVMILRYPISFAILAALEYRKLHTSFVPFVHNLNTSSVLPSSRTLDTGLPTCTTPTISSSCIAAIRNLSLCAA